MRARIFARSAWRCVGSARTGACAEEWRSRREVIGRVASERADRGDRADRPGLTRATSPRRRATGPAPSSARTEAVTSAMPGTGARAEGLRSEEDASHELRVERAVVAAPDVPVVLEDLLRRDAEGRLPGDAVAGPVGHDEVRDQARVEPAVDLLALEDARDGALARWPGRSGPSSLAMSSSRSASYGAPGVDDPVRLAALQVHVDVAEPHRVRARLATSRRSPRTARARRAPRGSCASRRP